MNSTSEVKHVTIVFNNMSDGGIGSVCLNYAKYLLTRGYTVDFVLFHFSGERLKHIPERINLFVIDDNFLESKLIWDCSIPTEKIQRVQTLQKFIPISRYFRCVLPNWPHGLKIVPLRNYELVARSYAFATYLENRKPNLVLSNMAFLHHCSLVGREISEVSVPIICSIHSPINQFLDARSNRTLRKLLPLADKVHTVSKGIREDLITLGYCPREKITTVYNPVAVSEIQELAKQPSGHPWLDRKRFLNCKVVLAVGRLFRQKNFSLLIESFAEIEKKTNCRLIILGEGYERNKLQNLINQKGQRGRISMPGWVANPYAFMNRADVFVSSSNLEGFNVALVEAMGCGCSVVATDCPHGPGEILANGRFGKLVPVNNRRALASAILEALNDNSSTEKAMKKALDFSPNRIFPQFHSMLNQVLKSQSNLLLDKR